MRYFTILFVLLFFFSCGKEEDDFSKTVPNGDEIFMAISAGGEFINIDESPLTKGDAPGESVGVLGIQIYSAPLSAGEDAAYTPYAYGIFDDWTQLGFTAKRECKYKIEATMIAKAPDKLYMEDGAFREPLDKPVNNAFVYSESDKLQSLHLAAARLKDGQKYDIPDIDRYYGMKSDINPGVSANVSLFLKRVVFGVQYAVSGLTQGKIICELANAPVDTIYVEDNALRNIYTVGNITDAWGYNEAENKYPEMHHLKVLWLKEDGTVKVLAEQEVIFKRKTQTNVRMTIRETTGTVDVVLEDQALENGGNVDGGTEGEITFFGNITFTTQQEVEEFGAKGYSRVSGDIYINNIDNKITDLSPFSSLKSVNSLSINNMVSDNLTGLHNIETLNTLTLKNTTLKSLSAFSKVTVAFSFSFDNINTLKGLKNLKFVQYLQVRESFALKSLEGLENLTEAEVISFSDCGIENLDGLNLLKKVGNFTLIGCKNIKLINLESLSKASLLLFYGESASELKLPNLVMADRLQVIGGALKKVDLQKLERVNKELMLQRCNLVADSSLPALKTVGDLSFSSCDLKIMDWKNLEKITGNLEISSCNNLETISLEGLTQIEGNIDISHRSSLRYLRSFSLLKTIGGDLRIYNCKVLQGCDGLLNLKTINGNLTITSCEKLANVHGFDNLENIGGTLEISSCEGLMHLDDFSKVKSVGKDVSITTFYSSYLLSNVDGLRNIERIGGSLVLDVTSLTTINLFQGITIGQDILIKSEKLVSLASLASLTEINGNLTLSAPFTSLEGLKNISMINGNISITSSALTSLADLQWPSETNGSVTLSCGKVTDITPLKDIAIVNGDFMLDGMGCTTIGFPALTRVNGSFSVKSCSALTTINSLNNLTAVNGDLLIYRCSKLTALPLFSTDLEIQDYVEVDDCEVLANISSLGTIRNVGRMLRFTENDKLSNFCALKPLLSHANEIYTRANLYNPTKNDILNGKCSK